jgi:hypothetical protein
MHILQFTVQDFDEVAFLTLKRRPQFSFVREQVGRMVVHTISDDVGELGYYAIVPGTPISPYVYLEFFSYAAGMGAASPWFAFHSLPDSFKVVDERDRGLRTLCSCIFTDFIMRHALDKAGRPTKLREHLQQEEAGDILPFHFEIGGKFGTCRDLTANDVQAIVDRCRAFMDDGGKVPDFYDQLNIAPGESRFFTLETLRGWLKDPRFIPEDSEN